MKRFALLMALFAILSPTARADFLVRIGDVDGFGYNAAPGFRAANGGFANIGNLGVLSNGDFLPDINEDRTLADGSFDEFDFRTAAEIANTSREVGVGVTNAAGTRGSSFTDLSLNREFDARSAAGRVLIGGNPGSGLIRGPGGPFPSPPSSTLPNQPGFVFRFDVEKAVLDPGTPIFFNLVFGDYDVLPARIRIVGVGGSTRDISLMQQNSNTSDGLIQAATADLDFSDVFADAGSVWRATLNVDFLAPNEPYTAFDYVELSTTRLAVPEPASLALLGIGVVGGFGLAMRRRMSIKAA